MTYPIVIDYEKFSAFDLIRKHNKKELKDPETIIKKAWTLFSTTLTGEEIKYIEENFEELEREFRKLKKGD